MAVCGFNDDNLLNGSDDDCIDITRSTRTVQVPCTFNKMEQYTVKVPRQITEQRPRTVQYTDFENRMKSVPYTYNRSERRTRMETQSYQVPVTNTQTRMVPVTKKVAKTVMVPKTVYVDVTSQEPKQFTTTNMETRTRQVPVPYFVNVPETRYRTVTEKVPVQKTKVEMDTVSKTVYDTQVKNRCVQGTRICSKTIPVYDVRSKPPAPCRNEYDYGSGQGNGYETTMINIAMDQSTMSGTGMVDNLAYQGTENYDSGSVAADQGAAFGDPAFNFGTGDCATGDCAVVDREIDSGTADNSFTLNYYGDGNIRNDEFDTATTANQGVYRSELQNCIANCELQACIAKCRAQSSI